jgi:hypothetical protein
MFNGVTLRMFLVYELSAADRGQAAYCTAASNVRDWRPRYVHCVLSLWVCSSAHGDVI